MTYSLKPIRGVVSAVKSQHPAGFETLPTCFKCPRQRNPPGAPTLSVSDFTGISVLLMTPYNSLLAVKAVFLKVRADETLRMHRRYQTQSYRGDSTLLRCKKYPAVTILC